MENYDDLVVNGYVMATHEDALLARNELKKIEYIETHADMTNMTVVKSIYEKSLSNRTFSTPVGLEFMHSLYEMLISAGFNSDEIRPIPLFTTFRRINFEEQRNAKRRLTKEQKEELDLKAKYTSACIIAGILGVVIIIMIIITLNGTTPNALNYKKAVTNQYAAWEQELSEREKAVRDKERELEINPEFTQSDDN